MKSVKKREFVFSFYLIDTNTSPTFTRSDRNEITKKN